MKKHKRMFMVIYKKQHIISAVLIIMAFAFICVGIMINRSVDTSALPISNKIILIDPGHGGIDAGASNGDVLEKNLNLEIAMLVKNYIEENGGICYMTRVEDVNTADPNRSKGISQKQSDLQTRKKNIEDFNADVFVSIHMNKFSESKYSGLQVFYDKNFPESKKLAESVQKAAKDVIDFTNTRTAKATGDSIYVLKGNKIPSILVECGFLSNLKECENLKNPQYQRKVAWGIYLGIIQYLSH